jgi:hypothetical protein
MSTAIETIPNRHKVSLRAWVIAVTAAALLAGAIGSYMALRSGTGSSPAIVQTPRPSAIAPVKNLQSGAPPAGQWIKESRDVGGINGIVTTPSYGQSHQATPGTSGSSSSGTNGSNAECIATLGGGPC